MAKLNDSIFNFLTNFSVQVKVIFLMIFMVSGIIFWNFSYYEVGNKARVAHEKALNDFLEIEKLSVLLKSLEHERFVSILYVETKDTDVLSLQESRKETDKNLLVFNELESKSILVDSIVEKMKLNIKELKAVRKNILKKDIDSEEVVRFYMEKLTENILDSILYITQTINMKSLTAFIDFQQALEYSAVSRDLTFIAMSRDELDVDWFERLNFVEARAQVYFDHYKLNANKEILKKYREIYTKKYFMSINQLRQNIRDAFTKEESERFDERLWYTNSNLYLKDLETLVEMQKDLIRHELNTIHENDLQERNRNLILLFIPLVFILIVAFYFFLDMRFALKVILDFLKDEHSVSNERKLILKDAKNEFGDVYRAFIKYNNEIKDQMQINLRTYEYDSLTELPNRIKLLQVVSSNIKKMRYQSIFYIDVFNFSHINNSFGQDVGDTFLKETSKELVSILHRIGVNEYNDLSVYRMGSDEFVILCLSKEKVSDLTQILQKTYLVNCNDVVIPLSFSFGISEGDQHSTPSSLLSNAEIAQTHAKLSHRHFEVFDSYMVEEANHKENLEWVKKISNAFEKGLFEVHYQPIFDTLTKKMYKYEVLIRMRDADNSDEIISPGEFLEILQKSGHEKDLTKVIIDQSFASYKYCGINLSVNMTSDDLDDEIVQYLISETEKHNIEPENITIELVESEELLKTRYINIIQKIKAYGFKLAIDDFGTGYSNFAYLTQIKPDYIKIDGSLVKDIYENEQHARVVEGIYDFAQSLNIKTIAEFVSSEEIFEAIKAIGIEYVQGFYLGKVMSCDTIKKLREGEEV